MQSEQINELAAALAKAQGEFTAIPKGDVNPFFKSKYAGLPDVVLNAAPILSKNNLAISQFIVQNELGEDCLKTYLLHSSGQFIEHSMKLYLGKLDSQSMGSATTYARRYSYMSVLGLVADEDDDANKATIQASKGREYESRQHTEPQGVNPETGELDPRLEAILLAAANGATGFVADLASKYNQYGSLSDKQLDAGMNAAGKLLGGEVRVKASESKYKGGNSVPNEPQDYPFAPIEEQF